MCYVTGDVMNPGCGEMIEVGQVIFRTAALKSVEEINRIGDGRITAVQR
jgi:hypothetical protein